MISHTRQMGGKEEENYNEHKIPCTLKKMYVYAYIYTYLYKYVEIFLKDLER